MELLSKLGINVGLLIAQIVNFTIVVGALTYFVYKPLLNVLDKRSARIKKSMDDARKIESQKKELDEFRVEQMKKIDAEAGAFLEKAKQEADLSKQQIIAAAQEEAAKILARGEQQLTEERRRVLGEVQGQVAEMIVRLTQKILEREFSAPDQKRLLTDLTKEVSAVFSS